MRRRLLALLAAFVLAFGGTAVLLNYARSADERALEGQVTTEVFVVATPITKGTPAELIGDSLRVELVPQVARAEGVVERLDDLTGLVAAVDLVPGEQLLVTRFVAPESLEERPVVEVPEGLREISFQVPMDVVLGGRIAAGDRIGVIASFSSAENEGQTADDGSPVPDEREDLTKLLLDDLLVTFVQYTEAPIPTAGDVTAPTVDVVPSGSLVLTLAVDVAAAERLTFALEFGAIRITRLNDSSVRLEGSEVRTVDTIFE